MSFIQDLRKAGRWLFAESSSPESVDEHYQELGRAGTQSFHGIISEDFNSDFQGQRAIAIYNKMRRTDATINATLQALKLPILSAERTVESADINDQKQNEIADFVRKSLFEDLEGGFDSVLQELLSYKDFGFYYFEKVYEIKDGQVRLKKLAPRLPSAHYLWIMANNPSVPGVTQMLKGYDPTINTSTPEIPMSKLVVFTNNKEGDNYEGVSVLRTAYKHWFYKDMFYRIDGIKHERGAGVLKIQLPEGAGPSDKADAEELGENFKLGEATFIVQPNEKWKIELMTAGIADQSAALMESVKHHNREIVQNILASFLDLGSGTGGSFSLSKDQSSFFGLSLRATARYIDTVLNEQLVKELVILNFGEQKEYPKLRTVNIGETDYAEASAMVKTLRDAGVLDDSPEIKVWVRKTFGLPEATVEDFEDEEPEEVPEAKPEMKPKAEPIETPEPMEEMSEKRKFAERKFARDLTVAEQRVKLAELDTYFTDLETEAYDLLQGASNEQKDKMMKDAERIIDTKDVVAISALALIAQTPLMSSIRDLSKRAMEEGKRTAANEIGQVLPTTAPFAKKLLALKSDLLLEERTNEILETMKKKIVSILSKDISKSQAMFEISKSYDEVADYWNNHISGQVVIDSTNTGRASVFEANKQVMYALQRSEVLDSVTCPMCLSLDGRVVDQMNPFSKIGQVHSGCRGIWVALLKTDTTLPQIKELPKSILNRFTTIDGIPEVNQFTQLKKPIIGKTSRAKQAEDDGLLD